MEGNWRPQSQGDSSSMDATSAVDWRSQLQPEARQRIVNKIMETLKRHLPISVPEGLNELRKIAIRFEEKIYTAATSQSDYLRRISMKMLSMETKTQSSAPINPTNADVNQNPLDSGSLGIQSQINNPGHPRQLIQQNLPSNTSAAVQGSSGLAPALPSISGLAQSNISGVTQASNLQNISGISQISVNNAIGQGSQTDMYANAQRQRQQIISQQQQSQNPLMYQHHLQQQMLKKQLQQSSLLQPQMQQQQQHSLLPQNQLQSTQPSLMQLSSNLQANQSNMQQTQAANSLSAPQPGFQQSQLNQIQQPVPSLLQQNSQSIPRQQQVPSLQQQSAPISQQSTLSQHQLMGQQGNTSNMQQSQLHGQQNNSGDIQQQQQRLPIQQNNLLSMQQQQQQQIMNQQALSLHQQQQQQLASQNNMSGLQQRQQLLGSLPSASNLQSHQRAMLLQKQQQQQQQQTQHSSQSQQFQHQLSQQQLMPRFQSQPAQVQQQLLMQQPSHSLQREMQQRLQGPGSLLQAHDAMEQKPLIQTQRGLQEVSSSTSADSSAQTGHAGAVDWQEDCYQKVLSMKELYYADLNEFHHKINMKLQQQEAQVPPGKQSEQYEKLKGYKIMLDRMLQLLQISSKNSVPIGLKDKLPMYEKQIVNMVTSQRPKKIPPQAQGHQFQHPNVGNAHPIPHQQPSQVSQMQLMGNHANLVQQGPGTSLQSSGSSSVQHVSMPSTAHQNISSVLPPGSNTDSVQGSSFNLRHPGAIGLGQQAGLGSLQSSMSMPQQNNINALSQSAANPLHANAGPMQTGSSELQQQHIKQEQQLLQTQHMKQQLQQRHIQHQQTMQQQQRQQLLQHQQPLQQHLHQQQKQQQASQLPVHQIQQLHSMNELNELKARQGSGVKSGLYEYSAGQRHNYYNQQLKAGATNPVSSPQNLQVSSPQISHQSSPQIDQNSLPSSISKVKAPMQSANSPLVVTPSTPFAPSPVPVDSEKAISVISSLGHVHQQAPVALPQSHSLAVSTPGISASPLLAECTSHNGNQDIPTTSKTTERPVDRLIKMVQSLTPKSLCSSVSDIGSVVSMVDRIAGSAPGNGSRTAIGEDLVAMTKCRLQARNFMSQDGGATAKKMKRHTSAMPLNNASSAGSVNEGFMKLYGYESSELESTATSRIKRLKPEVNHALLEEIKEINQKLIDTVVDVSDEDADSVVAAAEGAEGTVVKCSYSAVALSPDLKARFASAQMSPIMPMRLLVPANYPKCSPVLLDNLPGEPSREFEDLSTKAKSKFSISLRCLSQPMLLGEMVKTWDACARKVILEYAQQAGGGSFSSTYGSWEYCVGA